MTKPERIGVSAWRDSGSATFWNWADAERERAPAIVLPLIDRQVKRIVVSHEEAVEIAAWARDVLGWDNAYPKPLRFSDRATGDTMGPPE
jgi:hypothetical protein